jgi:hypothetical protein
MSIRHVRQSLHISWIISLLSSGTNLTDGLLGLLVDGIFIAMSSFLVIGILCDMGWTGAIC